MAKLNFIWTKEIDSRLTELALSGLSARQCQLRLLAEERIPAWVTRNAVIGHARRIGLSFGGGTLRDPATLTTDEAERARKQRWREKRRAERIAAGWISRKKKAGGSPTGMRPLRSQIRPVVKFEPLRPLRETPPLVGGEGLRFEGLRGSAGVEGSSCRWPFGDPLDFDELRFCPETVARGSYCAAHGALAYVRPVRLSVSK